MLYYKFKTRKKILCTQVFEYRECLEEKYYYKFVKTTRIFNVIFCDISCIYFIDSREIINNYV